MKEIDSNQAAWATLSKDHYHFYLRLLQDGKLRLNAHIDEELGDLSDKTVLHLQCNTGADTMLLARRCAHVTGVDLVPQNIACARRMAEALKIVNADFVQSDVMRLDEAPLGQYDVVFTSEGVLGWLPDLRVWARNIRARLRPGGFLYVFDSHPFEMMFDEAKLKDDIYDIRYPYFGHEPDVDDGIGGYASERKSGVKAYFWMHTFSEIIGSLLESGLQLEWLHEFPENFFDIGEMRPAALPGLYEYPCNTGRYPMSFSLKARG